MKTRIPSTVIISALTIINLFFISVILPLDKDFFSVTVPDEPNAIIMLYGVAAAGIAFLFFVGWLLSILITHSICLIFTIKNRKSPLRAVRIINLVLDAVNVFLIVSPAVKLILWRFYI